jgi:hypothetical protein
VASGSGLVAKRDLVPDELRRGASPVLLQTVDLGSTAFLVRTGMRFRSRALTTQASGGLWRGGAVPACLPDRVC